MVEDVRDAHSKHRIAKKMSWRVSVVKCVSGAALHHLGLHRQCAEVKRYSPVSSPVNYGGIADALSCAGRVAVFQTMT